MKNTANQIQSVNTEINGIVDGEFVFLPVMYKGFQILSATINVDERSEDNLIIIVENGTDRFYLGLDDSKSCGYRKTEAVNFEDAISYIEWLLKVRGTKPCS